MPTASLRVIKQFFEKHLHFTPTSGDVDLFEADLRRVNPALMHGALLELAGSRKLAFAPAAEWRREIFKIYYRKIAEHAQLFPVFHCFETAFRASMAVELESHYTLSRWWEPIANALQSGRSATSVDAIQGQPVPKDAAHAIGVAVQHMINTNRYGKAATGYEFADDCDLAHVGRIVSEHWGVFGPLLGARRSISKSDFEKRFRRVRDARNDVYHHRSFGGMTAVYSSAEDLLDRLDCSLRATHAAVGSAKAKPPEFSVAIETRHGAI